MIVTNASKVFQMTNKDQADQLASTISEAIRTESASAIKTLVESIDRLAARVEKLEAASAPSTAVASIIHPSQEHFAVAEAIADSLFGMKSKEKACTFERDRPCDHCSMCSSRGF